MAAIVQLLYFPHYRTTFGFCQLFEKEFVRYLSVIRAGYNFGERHGFEREAQDKDQESPVALQFLDCVHQLWCQHTSEFEFSLELLLFLGYHLYSGAFGNLLFKNMKERLDKSCLGKTVSIWSYVLAQKATFANQLFSPLKRHLHARYREKQLRVWRELFCSLDDSLKRDQGANAASGLQFPPLSRSVASSDQDLTLEEKLMLEVLRLRQENNDLKTKLKQSQGDGKTTILATTCSSDKELDANKQISSESEEEPDIEGKFD